ncbi:MAG TPA: AMP-binding protein, partial [Acidimicrobiales bacterium]
MSAGNEPRTIPDALIRAAERWPDKEAVVGDDGGRWTFAELLDHARRYARALVASGIEPGDRVALWAPNSPAWIAASFGTYLAGAVQVPLNTRYKGEEAAHVLRTSEAKLLLTVTDLLGRSLLAELDGVGPLPALAERVVLAGDVPPDATGGAAFLARGDADGLDTEVDRRAEAVGPDDPSDIIFTSGTTGAAKGAVLGHGASVRTYT